jgi:hypothetical protein
MTNKIPIMMKTILMTAKKVMTMMKEKKMKSVIKENKMNRLIIRKRMEVMICKISFKKIKRAMKNCMNL